MIPFWKRNAGPLPPEPMESPTPLPVPAPVLAASIAAPEHRVFDTHRDAIELWGIVRDEDYAAGVSYEEVFALNDGVDANGVAK